MRYLFFLAVLGVATPGVATGQDLGSRTLLPMQVACTAFPVTAPPLATLTVAGSTRGDGRQSLALGETAIIRAGAAQGVAVGQTYVARRVAGSRDPDRRGQAGFAGVITAAVLTITAVDDTFALARIGQGCGEVLVGDYLEPAVLPVLPVPSAAGAPDFTDRATVLFGRDLRTTFGDGDLLAIDRGTAHGVAPGSRFALYRDSRDGLPLTAIGEAVVLDAAATSARAVVVRVRDVVAAGDVAVRRVPTPP